MKTILKVFGIAALVAVIGFGMVSCGGGGGDGGPSIPSFPGMGTGDLTDGAYAVGADANVPDTKAELDEVFDVIMSILGSSYYRMESVVEDSVESSIQYNPDRTYTGNLDLSTIGRGYYANYGATGLAGTANISGSSFEGSSKVSAKIDASYSYDNANDNSSYGLGQDGWLRSKVKVVSSQVYSDNEASSYNEESTAMSYGGGFKIGEFAGKFITKLGYAYSTTYSYRNESYSYESGPDVSGNVIFYDNAGEKVFEYAFSEAELMDMFNLSDYTPPENEDPNYNPGGNEDPDNENPGGGGGYTDVPAKLPLTASYADVMDKFDEVEDWLNDNNMPVDGGFYSIRDSMQNAEPYWSSMGPQIIPQLNAMLDSLAYL